MLDPLLQFISTQQGIPQEACAMFAMGNIARTFDVTMSLGLLERTKQMILKGPPTPVNEALESLHYIS